MAEVLPRHYVIGILIFTLFIVGGVSMLAEFRSVDSAFGTASKLDEFNDTFNKLDDITGEVNDLEAGVRTSEPDMGVFGVLNALISSAWNTLKLLPNSLSFMNSAFRGLSSIFGVPSWVPTIIISLVTVVIVFAIFSAIFQRDI